LRRAVQLALTVAGIVGLTIFAAAIVHDWAAP
jgi:hypothetical protein